MLASSGVVLLFAPRGRDAGGWDLLGLGRWEWGDVHVCFALLMLAAALPHIWINRKPLLDHLRQKAAAATGPLRELRVEVLAAAALCLVVLAGAIWQVPPIGYVAQLRDGLRDAGRPGLSLPMGAGPGWRHRADQNGRP